LAPALAVAVAAPIRVSAAAAAPGAALRPPPPRRTDTLSRHAITGWEGGVGGIGDIRERGGIA
jgi:hypothetical protein